MPSDEPPKPKYEMTVKDLESFLEVQIEAENSTGGQLLEKLRTELVKFIVTSEHDIIISNLDHEIIMARHGEGRRECLLTDGLFRSSADGELLIVGYTYNETERIPHIHEATENKIKEFLVSKGFPIKRVLHLTDA